MDSNNTKPLEKTDNELIAEFMGLKRLRYETCVVADGTNRREKTPVFEIFPKQYLPHQLQYQTSWDWLMPVVEKIHDVAPVEVREINNESLSIFEFGSICIPIDDVYKAVVEFIKYYNSTKTL